MNLFHLNENNLKIQWILLDPFVTLLYRITSKCDNHKWEYDLEDIVNSWNKFYIIIYVIDIYKNCHFRMFRLSLCFTLNILFIQLFMLLMNIR